MVSTCPFPPVPARVHEVGGPLAFCFAAALAGVDRQAGPVLWVHAGAPGAGLSPRGMAEYFDPGRLLLARAQAEADRLAVMEEALRDGAVPLVVAEVRAPLTLTAGRRLQLAAKAGRATGICLIPTDMGSPAAQTRWICSPVFDPLGPETGAVQRWDLVKNKAGPLGHWHLRWDRATRQLRSAADAETCPQGLGA